MNSRCTVDCHLFSSFQSAMHVHCLRSVVHRQDEKLVETSRDATYVHLHLQPTPSSPESDLTGLPATADFPTTIIVHAAQSDYAGKQDPCSLSRTKCICWLHAHADACALANVGKPCHTTRNRTTRNASRHRYAHACESGSVCKTFHIPTNHNNDKLTPYYSPFLITSRCIFPMRHPH